ncbi:MAG: anaerobic ribonucleoside-triphosphate reductase, partial [Candidatus Bathyarchaeia archaeon]
QNDKALEFVDEISRTISSFLDKTGRKRNRRLLPSLLFDSKAAERLATLDADRYGFGRIKFSGSRNQPYYSSLFKLAIKDDNTLSELSDVEQKLQGLSAGGSLAVIELGEAKLEPSQLLAITRRIFEQRKLDFITYNRIFTYCANCRKSWLGSLSKCPSCNTIGKLSVFNRYALL